MIRHQLCLAAFAAFGIASSPVGAAILGDDFEVDSSANYTLKTDANSPLGDGGADSTSQFAFDYIGAGIPLAPNSALGTRGGLRFTVNATEEGSEGPSTTEEDHITAFHNLLVSAPFYQLSVDVYMGVQATQPGTTEFMHVGVAAQNTTNYNSIFTPIAGSGHFVAVTGEGGSASDYRHFVEGGLVPPSGDPSYLNSTNTTQATGDTYVGIFPATQFPGSPGNTWATLTITVTPADVTYAFNGTPFIRTPTVVSSGLVSLGYTDPFDSVGPHFVIYDNLSVTEIIPEPSTSLLALAALAGFAPRRR